MSDEHDKGMLNEILPDPTRGAEDLADGLPRRRTADHLRKILAAGLALQLASDMAGCSSPDPTPPKAPEMAQPGQPPPPPVTRTPPAPPWLPPNGPGYGVVDMLPISPPVPPRGGFLSLTSTPVASITIDGRKTGLDTPQAAIALRPGRHRIRLDVADEQLSRTFEVKIAPGETLVEDRDLRAMPPGPPKK